MAKKQVRIWLEEDVFERLETRASRFGIPLSEAGRGVIEEAFEGGRPEPERSEDRGGDCAAAFVEMRQFIGEQVSGLASLITSEGRRLPESSSSSLLERRSESKVDKDIPEKKSWESIVRLSLTAWKTAQAVAYDMTKGNRSIAAKWSEIAAGVGEIELKRHEGLSDRSRVVFNSIASLNRLLQEFSSSNFGDRVGDQGERMSRIKAEVQEELDKLFPI